MAEQNENIHEELAEAVRVYIYFMITFTLYKHGQKESGLAGCNRNCWSA